MTESGLRVLLVCDHVGYEGHLHGSGRMMVEMASGLAGPDLETIACVLQSGGPLETRLRGEGIPIRFLGYHRFDPRQLPALVWLVRRHSVDVVHAWDFGASTFGRLAALLTARAVAVSPSVREFAIARMGFRPDQVVVIPNLVAPSVAREVPDDRLAELREHYGLDGDAPVIGSVTRFHEEKGIRVLVEALPRIRSAVPDVELLLVGDGPLRHDLERRAGELGVRDRVLFVGFQHDVAAHLRLFTVTAMPSLEEGFGLSAAESVVAGVPVVASRVGGLPDVIADGRSGVLVPPGAPDPAGGRPRPGPRGREIPGAVGGRMPSGGRGVLFPALCRPPPRAVPDRHGLSGAGSMETSGGTGARSRPDSPERSVHRRTSVRILRQGIRAE